MEGISFLQPLPCSKHPQEHPETAESLFLRDTCVGNTIVVVVQEFLLLLCGKVSVARHSVIVGVCYEIHDILFEVVC